MRKMFLLFSLCLMALAPLACSRIVSAPSVPPPTATPTPTTACGFTLLGTTLCGATDPGLTVIKTLAAWNSFAGNDLCATSTTPPIASFATQMVLVYNIMSGGQDPRSSATFTGACLFPDHMAVTLQYNYQSSIGAPMVLGPCLCQNVAIAVPQTSMPITYTECDSVLTYNSTVSTSCGTTVY